MAHILVTGGSRGIGAATVEKFAVNGDTVSFTYLKSVAEAEALAARTGSYAFPADSRNPDAIRAAVCDAVAQSGPVDVLVNNA